MSSVNPAMIWQRIGRKRRIRYAVRLIRGLLLGRHFACKRFVLAGSGVRIERQHGRILLGELVGLGSDVGIAVVGRSAAQPATLEIGSSTHIQDRTHINCFESITIGQGCAISWDVEIMDTDIHQVVDGDGNGQVRTEPVVIGDRVWVGTRAIILKGVTIGHDSVIAAGSVVTRSVPSCTVSAGNPARVIRQIEGWRP